MGSIAQQHIIYQREVWRPLTPEEIKQRVECGEYWDTYCIELIAWRHPVNFAKDLLEFKYF